ncbi:hypothetical protein LCGC14_2667030, partial [marine sediment metagenome]
SARATKVTTAQLLTSDACTTTTKHMVDVYKDKCKSLTVLPNCIDPEDWMGHMVDPMRKDDKSIRIIFAGGAGHYGDLLECQTAVTRIMDEYPNVRMFFMGCFPDWAVKWSKDARDPSNNRAFSVHWADFTLWRRILMWGGFDIALAPLVNNQFNLCKSNLKYLDYGMAGIPGVYSNISTYNADVVHENTGMLANTPDEWYNHLKALVTSSTLRHDISRRAHDMVMASYNIQDRIGLWEQAYDGFATLPANVEAKAWQPYQYQQQGRASASPVIASR